MSTESNKQVVHKFYEAIQNEDYAAAAQLCHSDFVFYLQIDTPIHGAAGFIASEKKNFDAFPGFSFQIERLIAEGDQVAAGAAVAGEVRDAADRARLAAAAAGGRAAVMVKGLSPSSDGLSRGRAAERYDSAARPVSQRSRPVPPGSCPASLRRRLRGPPRRWPRGSLQTTDRCRC